MRGVKVDHPSEDLFEIEPKSCPEPIAGDLVAPRALMHPPPGHAEKAAQFRHGQQAFGKKRIRVTWCDGRDRVRPSAVSARTVHPLRTPDQANLGSFGRTAACR